jgi:hypothetical protein
LVEHFLAKEDVASSSLVTRSILLTYLLFVSILEQPNKNEQLSFEPGVAEMLLVTGQHDGVDSGVIGSPFPSSTTERSPFCESGILSFS